MRLMGLIKLARSAGGDLDLLTESGPVRMVERGRVKHPDVERRLERMEKAERRRAFREAMGALDEK